MFEDELKKYSTNGVFSFKLSECLKEKCNAPTDKSGIYLIYKILLGEEVLVYIGSSGQKKKDGTLKTRIGGMKDRLVKGYHPNRFDSDKRIQRRKAFPQQMKAESIEELKVYWWVTYDDNICDFPTEVESNLIKEYRYKFNKLPDWHKFRTYAVGQSK